MISGDVFFEAVESKIFEADESRIFEAV